LCGIAGFTHQNYRPDPSIVRAMRDSIVHRGPDQQGIFESSQIALAAVRLKIIDLGGGDQPLSSEDGDKVIVFNGEVYNHNELRRELEALGHRFHSRCDTEVVLRAFLEWDTRSFPRLRGMFAFAIWTESERRLVLVRDRMGIKPLYVCRRGRDLHFGSEMKAIFGHPSVERHLDEGGLAWYLSLNYVPGARTLIGGIEKLPPGYWMEWRDGAVESAPYWSLRFEPRERSLASAKEELDSLLSQSIKEHLISDVPLGVWSSGGLDSSAVIHYASQSVSQLKTFSVSFRGRSFDESAYFREVAQRYGTDHHEFDLNPSEDLPAAIEQIAYHSDEPSADAGALPVWYLSQMTRSHVTVALSGEGADELFGGYNTYLADGYARALRRIPAALRRAALASLQLWPVSDEKISLEYKLKRFLGGSLLPPVAAHCYWNGTFSEAERAQLLAKPAPCDFTALMSLQAAKSGEINRYLWVDQLNYLPDDILYKCDRMSMAHSLEVRPPFLDHRIVEFAATLPERLKIRGSSLKFVLRELMRDKLPAAILARKKEGFDIPAHEWLRGPLRPLLLETVNRAALEKIGVFRAPAVEAVIRSHLERRANLGYHLWGLLILFLWIARWNVQAPSSACATKSIPILTTN
jgi:asparagine synthase (glutamine-hydrolysing)